MVWQAEHPPPQAALCDKPGEEASLPVKEFQKLPGPSSIRKERLLRFI